jgi:hypothetical protein
MRAAGFGGAPDDRRRGLGYHLQAGQEIALDPAGALFTQVGSGNLRQVTPAQETGGSYGTGELRCPA